jgi:hypothetical protein
VVVDLAMSIACDRSEFHGRALKTKGLRVVILLFEGEYAIPRRMLAWMKKHETRPAPDRLLLRYDLAKLQDETGFASLRDDLLRVRADIVIVDTLGAATAGLDEDKAKDMGPIIERLRDLARSLDGMCLLVAHPPKGNAETVRGSNVLECNTDGLIVVREEDEGISLVARKVRAGAAAKPINLQFRTIELGPDPRFSGRGHPGQRPRAGARRGGVVRKHHRKDCLHPRQHHRVSTGEGLGRSGCLQAVEGISAHRSLSSGGRGDRLRSQ